MANKKVRMNLAELRLKSFETTPEVTEDKGTVHGYCGDCTICTLGTTPETCGHTGWNASTTDEYRSPC